MENSPIPRIPKGHCLLVARVDIQMANAKRTFLLQNKERENLRFLVCQAQNLGHKFISFKCRKAYLQQGGRSPIPEACLWGATIKVLMWDFSSSIGELSAAKHWSRTQSIRLNLLKSICFLFWCCPCSIANNRISLLHSSLFSSMSWNTSYE